ncbi:hypothetical protein MRX96_049268 [Rhipicephalus microplus]
MGPSDFTPGPSGVAEASNNTYLQPSVPHTPWFRVIDAHRKKVVAEEASAMPPATFHQREHRHGTGRPRLPRLPVEDHKLPPNNQPRSRPQHASSEGHGRSARSKRSKTPKHGKQTSQPIQPGAPPPFQASAHSSRNYPPPSSQCSAKSYSTWPALPQREPTHAPGLEARAAVSSSSGLAAGGRLDQAPTVAATATAGPPGRPW